MRDLPRGWAWTTLGGIAETRLGKMLSAKARSGNGGRPYLRNKNVQWARIDVDDLLTMNFTDEEFEKFRLRDGDLLVCEGGEVGRSAIWRAPVSECAYQKALHRVRPRGGVVPQYLLYLLMHYSDTHAFDRHVTGSTIAHLPQEDLRRLPVPLPPLAEQRRIVAAIEEHLSRLDAVRSLLSTASERAIRMKVLILNSVFSSIEDHAPLKQLAEVRLGRQRSPKNHSGPSMRLYLRAANVTWNGLKLDDVKEMNFSEKEAVVYELKPGDVLLAEASGSASEVGKPVIWGGELRGCCFQNTLIRVRSHGPAPEYLRLVFLRAALLGQFAKASPGVGIHHLGSSRLAEWPIPLCSIEEQEAIAQGVERQFSLVDALHDRVVANLRRTESLRRGILSAAFRGELAPHDPSDEPASVLLEQIAVERAAAPTQRRRRRVASGR